MIILGLRVGRKGVQLKIKLEQIAINMRLSWEEVGNIHMQRSREIGEAEENIQVKKETERVKELVNKEEHHEWRGRALP